MNMTQEQIIAKLKEIASYLESGEYGEIDTGDVICARDEVKELIKQLKEV